MFRRIRSFCIKFMEELNYEREALFQGKFKDAWKSTPEIVIPEPFPEYSTRSILTQKYEDSILLMISPLSLFGKNKSVRIC